MTTKRDAQETFVRMARAAGAIGLDVGGWALEPGSRTNGIAWSVRTPIGSSGLVGLPPFGHIGRTAAEADRFLAGMAAAFESVAYARRRSGVHTSRVGAGLVVELGSRANYGVVCQRDDGTASWSVASGQSGTAATEPAAVEAAAAAIRTHGGA